MGAQFTRSEGQIQANDRRHVLLFYEGVSSAFYSGGLENFLFYF